MTPSAAAQACGPSASLASCSDCAASLANSRVEVSPLAEGGALLSITTVSAWLGLGLGLGYLRVN